MPTRTYVEDFDDGPGGWATHQDSLDIQDGVAISRSPWWVDPNHAPPGGGYLHLLYVLWTTAEYAVNDRGNAGPNRFVADGFPTDFTNARMTVRIKGELEARGTNLVLLAQAQVGKIRVNSVLTGQPITVTPDWSEQTITLAPDPDQWLCIGTRHDRTDTYGYGEIADVLRDLNVDIILVLHPLDVVPAGQIDGAPHVLSAGRDYAVDQSRLPEGHVMLDQVRIEFPGI